MPSFSLTRLISAAIFYTYSNQGQDDKEEVIIWGEGLGVFNMPSSSGLPTDSIITFPHKSGVFPHFSDATAFLDFYIFFPYPDSFYFAPTPSSYPYEGLITVSPKLLIFYALYFLDFVFVLSGIESAQRYFPYFSSTSEVMF